MLPERKVGKELEEWVVRRQVLGLRSRLPLLQLTREWSWPLLDNAGVPMDDILVGEGAQHGELGGTAGAPPGGHNRGRLTDLGQTDIPAGEQVLELFPQGPRIGVCPQLLLLLLLLLVVLALAMAMDESYYCLDQRMDDPPQCSSLN